MISDRRIKTHNAVAYFVHAFAEFRGDSPTQMWIYKLLALLDFRILKKIGKPSLGLVYKAFKNGPVPVEIYDNRASISFEATNGLYEFRKGKTAMGDSCYYVNPGEEPNLNYFSDMEIDVIDVLCKEFMSKGKTLETLVNATHSEIRSWQIAWNIAEKNNREAIEMNWRDEFPQLSEKGEEGLTPVEDAFLMFCGCSQLEEDPCAL